MKKYLTEIISINNNLNGKQMQQNKNIKETKVLIVQQINRAYRVPLLNKLSETPGINLTMIHGTNEPVQAGDVGISRAIGTMSFRTIAENISGIRYKGREILWFGKALDLIKKENFDIVISDHYTRLLSIWPMQSIQRKKNKAFILWGIGFHQYPTPVLDKFRKKLSERSNALLLYSENEKKKYVEMGISEEKCFVTQNTVDIEGIDAGMHSVTEENSKRCKQRLGIDNGPILMHVGRLAPNKRLDLLISALNILKNEYPKVTLVLIGEGPEKEKLKQLAKKHGLSDSVFFCGEITDHRLLAPYMTMCDLIVAPGQIGLLAPMALTYRKTLVMSDDKKLHGPEAVQAIVPGENALTYCYENVDDLVLKIKKLIDDPLKRIQFADDGNNRVRQIMGPEKMLQAFISAINYVNEKMHAE